MNRKSVMAVMVMAASLVSTQAVYAASNPVMVNGHMVYAKAKMVKFTLKSESAEPLKLNIGGSEVTLAPGKQLNVELPAGQSVTAVESTKTYAAGTIVATAAVDLDGSTVTVR